MSAPASRRGTIENIRNMSFSQKPDIEISLQGSEGVFGCNVQSFSTLDRIDGVARIAPRADTSFQDIEIAMIGSTRTYVDKLATAASMSGRTEANHRFLRLVQPISPSQIPANRTFEAGRTYTIPFTFVVPTHLLPRACSHKCDNHHVKEAHLLLPPSFGDPGPSNGDGKPLDDLAPEMARVSYAISVKLTDWNNDGTENIIMESSKKLQIKPAYEEQAPLNIDNDTEYCGRQEKTLRKGLMKGKLGRLIMEATQPRPFQLPATAPGDKTPPITSMAKVRLRFDPHDVNSQPPELGSLSSKLKVTTFYASSPRHSFPTRPTTYPDISQGYISETLPLSTLCIASVEWQRHEPEASTSPLARRDSALSDSSLGSTDGTTPAPSAQHKAHLPYHTATIIVPLSLPQTKAFVPTFHSCIVSRLYSLSLGLSTHGPSLGPSLTLKLPIQVSAEGSVQGVERRRRSERAQEELRQADAFFEPRLLGIARHQSLPAAAAADLPPGYEGLPAVTRRQRASGAGADRLRSGVAGVMVVAH